MCRTIDIGFALKHLSGIIFDKWMDCLAKWATVLSKNKYDVGRTEVQYSIRLNDTTPIKSYIPQSTKAMI